MRSLSPNAHHAKLWPFGLYRGKVIETKQKIMSIFDKIDEESIYLYLSSTVYDQSIMVRGVPGIQHLVLLVRC